MERKRSIDAVVAGHICLDIIPRFPDTTPASLEAIFCPGKLIAVEDAAVSTGGVVSNTGIALDILGHAVAFCAKVGDDFLGRTIIGLLASRGRTDGVRVASGEGSSYSIVLAPPGIDRMFLHSPGTNHTFTSADVDWELVGQARHFHLGYPPLMRGLYADGGAELARVFQLAKEAGATTSLDMALPDPASEAGRVDWNAVLAKTLPYVDVFLPSAEELFYLLEPGAFLERRERVAGGSLIEAVTAEDNARWAGRCLSLGCAVVCIKNAHRGYYCRTAGRERLAALGAAAPADLAAWAGRELWCPGFVVAFIASATGSGDASIAGFIASLLRGLPLAESLRMANAVGACNLAALDSLSGLRSWDETRSLLHSGTWRPCALELGAGWTFSETEQVWERR